MIQVSSTINGTIAPIQWVWVRLVDVCPLTHSTCHDNSLDSYPSSRLDAQNAITQCSIKRSVRRSRGTTLGQSYAILSPQQIRCAPAHRLVALQHVCVYICTSTHRFSYTLHCGISVFESLRPWFQLGLTGKFIYYWSMRLGLTPI